MESERERLERVYQGYENDANVRRRWSSANRGNLLVESERRKAVHDVLESAGLWPPVGYPILEVGCGTGQVLAGFREAGAQASDLTGFDILADRIQAAHDAHPELRFVRADARTMPFASGSFRLVVAFTVFSSIVDRSAARAVANEVDRVLEDRGSILWYDFRVSHPGNPHTRGMPRRVVRELFGSFDIEFRAITLVPQIARRLGPATPLAYRALASVPLLRTHYLGLLTKRSR